MILFKKTYDGESLYDLGRDIAEALESQYNPLVDAIPTDEYGIQEGEFVVTIDWKGVEGKLS